MMKRNQNQSKRGTVMVVVLIVLMLVGLFVVGIVNATARELDASARRLETVRAFYAAEAGVNMAFRELMLSSDEDGDGVIGSISDDGNDNNNPSIGNASMMVGLAPSGGNSLITSTGRSGLARRSIEALVQ